MPTRDLHPHYDVIIVGARVAGAASALLLARRGLSVLALDRRAYGADALSTHALMRAGVLQLARWGLLDAIREAGTPRVDTTTFHYGESAVPVPIEPRGVVDGLYAPRRALLDRLLADAARASGADVRFGVGVERLVQSLSGRVQGVVIRDASGVSRQLSADLVIGADGANSRTARQVGAQVYRQGRHSAATSYAYFAGLPAQGYHWGWNPELAAGLIPTNAGLSCVFVSSRPERLSAELAHDMDGGFRRVLAQAAPTLSAQVASAHRVTAYRRFPGLSSVMRRSYGPGWALVGDAGYFKDPISAHGISDALRDAELLARAVVSGSSCAFAEYQAARDAMSEALFDMTDRIASFAWSLDELRQLHQELSNTMRAENRMLLELDRGKEHAA